jgi:tetratricopeptide (TPR) repeat protein
LRDRYLGLIDQIVETTLKGQIRSKEQVYQNLVREIEPGTGEIFERCFQERFEATQAQTQDKSNELKQAKAERILRALKTIQGEWERYQKEHQASSAIASTVQTILAADPEERFPSLIRAIDANQTNSLTSEQLKQLAKTLESTPISTANSELTQTIRQLVAGIKNGLASWQRLEDHLISWIYEQNRQLGFEGTPGQASPWELWAKQVETPLLKDLFQTLSRQQSIAELVQKQSQFALADWVELAIVLQYLQRGLVAWFEKQPYDSRWGTKQAIAAFLSFAVIWGQLSTSADRSGFSETDLRQLIAGCFQMVLQTLRTFSQRAYFPLYGGVYALFSGGFLRDTLNYLNEPLKQVEGTQEKARILTLLGYSQRTMGQTEQALVFHREAAEIAQQAGDRICEIANLNHISRSYINQKDYEAAISSSQKALVLARQTGDQLGEANALTNLGYSEVLLARQQERVDPEELEIPVSYLQQGLRLLERTGGTLLDGATVRQSQALCFNSLGIAHVILGQPQLAQTYLQQGVEAAQFSGDLYLQGLNYLFLAQVSYEMGDRDSALYAACLSMYLLEQIHSEEWRVSAGLLTIMQGQFGEEGFRQVLTQQRPRLIAIIGVDGYDHLPHLLEEYRRSLD